MSYVDLVLLVFLLVIIFILWSKPGMDKALWIVLVVGASAIFVVLILHVAGYAGALPSHLFVERSTL